MARNTLVYLAISIIIQLPFSCCTYLPQAATYAPFNRTQEHNRNYINAKMRFEMRLHGILLWASLGFLMPIGMLVIRISQKEKVGTRLKFYFYFHLILQMTSVVLATTGAIMSIKTFENLFNNKHQRIGLALYGAIWVQTVFGFLRPHRGAGKRSLWYILHWIFGTIICIVGILNIYIGLEAYQKRTKRSVSRWKCLFTVQIILMVVLYLFQDKWDYVKNQCVNLGEGGQVRPSDQENSQIENNNVKNLLREPCSKTNALGNLFTQ